jgi:hypothetical protein
VATNASSAAMQTLTMTTPRRVITAKVGSH